MSCWASNLPILGRDVSQRREIPLYARASCGHPFCDFASPARPVRLTQQGIDTPAAATVPTCDLCHLLVVSRAAHHIPHGERLPARPGKYRPAPGPTAPPPRRCCRWPQGRTRHRPLANNCGRPRRPRLFAVFLHRGGAKAGHVGRRGQREVQQHRIAAGAGVHPPRCPGYHRRVEPDRGTRAASSWQRGEATQNKQLDKHWTGSMSASRDFGARKDRSAVSVAAKYFF